MQFLINQKIFTDFPGLHIGVVVARGINNVGITSEVLEKIKAEEKRIREMINPEELSAHPNIAVWRETYRRFGAKPKEHRSSIENLYRMILNGKDLTHINQAVDIYNLISIRHTIPVGGEDLDKMAGDLQLTFATENENPVLMLGEQEPKIPHVGEVIYKDDVGTICRRWNWREADRTKLTEETTNAIFVLEALLPVTKEELETTTNSLKDLMEKYCGGKYTWAILNENTTAFPIL